MPARLLDKAKHARQGRQSFHESGAIAIGAVRLSIGHETLDDTEQIADPVLKFLSQQL